MKEKDTKSVIFKFDISTLLYVCRYKPELFVPVFLRLLGNDWVSDKIEERVNMYLTKLNTSKVTNRNFLLDKSNTLLFLANNAKYAKQYIVLAAHRSLSTYRLTGETGLPIIEYPELDTSSHNPLLYHENGYVRFVPEKYNFDRKMANLI